MTYVEPFKKYMKLIVQNHFAPTTGLFKVLSFHRLPHFYFYPAKQIGKGTISYSAIPTLLDSSFPCPSIIFYMLYFVTDTPDLSYPPRISLAFTV